MDAQALLALAAQASPDPRDPNSVALLQAAMRAEKASLPDPYLVDPTQLFAWTAEATLREVRIAARPDVADADDAFDAGENILGLNRSALLVARWKTYELLDRMRGIMASAPARIADAIRDELLVPLIQPDAPFSAMSTYFVREEWGLI